MIQVSRFSLDSWKAWYRVWGSGTCLHHACSPSLNFDPRCLSYRQFGMSLLPMTKRPRRRMNSFPVLWLPARLALWMCVKGILVWISVFRSRTIYQCLFRFYHGCLRKGCSCISRAVPCYRVCIGVFCNSCQKNKNRSSIDVLYFLMALFVLRVRHGLRLRVVRSPGLFLLSQIGHVPMT